MNKGAVMAILIAGIFLVSGCAIKQAYNEFTFEWSDGACMKDSDCTAFEYGCGGGHIQCTSNASKWKDVMSTCDIVENHPSQKGFRCACVEKEKKCGWVK